MTSETNARPRRARPVTSPRPEPALDAPPAAATPTGDARPDLNAHAMSPEAVAAGLGVDPGRGLSAGEAARRAAASGPNELQSSHAEPLWRILVESITEPFVL